MKKKARKSNILRRLRKRFAPKLLSASKGQSTTEYILILAVVVMLALKFKNTFKDRLSKVIDKLGTQIDTATDNEDL